MKVAKMEISPRGQVAFTSFKELPGRLGFHVSFAREATA